MFDRRFVSKIDLVRGGVKSSIKIASRRAAIILLRRSGSIHVLIEIHHGIGFLISDLYQPRRRPRLLKSFGHDNADMLPVKIDLWFLQNHSALQVSRTL